MTWKIIMELVVTYTTKAQIMQTKNVTIDVIKHHRYNNLDKYCLRKGVYRELGISFMTSSRYTPPFTHTKNHVQTY